MLENTQPGDLVTRLQITGTSSEITTRLIYNSSDVKTNGTDYFRLDFTNLYLRFRMCLLDSYENEKETFSFFSSRL